MCEVLKSDVVKNAFIEKYDKQNTEIVIKSLLDDWYTISTPTTRPITIIGKENVVKYIRKNNLKDISIKIGNHL